MPKADDIIKAQLARLGSKKRKPRTPAPAPATTDTAKAAKVSVSLYPEDHERIRAIVAHLAQAGHVVSASRALQLALRTARVGPELVTAHEQAQDGRRTKGGTA